MFTARTFKIAQGQAGHSSKWNRDPAENVPKREPPTRNLIHDNSETSIFQNQNDLPSIWGRGGPFVHKTSSPNFLPPS